MTTLMYFLGFAYLTEGKNLNDATSSLLAGLIENLNPDDFIKGRMLSTVARAINGTRI